MRRVDESKGGYPKKKQARKSKYMTSKERGKLWVELSRLCRDEADGQCSVCGGTPKPRGLHAHHIIGRGQSALLYLAACNIMVVCMSCHNTLSENPFLAMDIYTERYSVQYLDTLMRLGRLTGIKRTYEEAVEQMTWSIEDYGGKYL